MSRLDEGTGSLPGRNLPDPAAHLPGPKQAAPVLDPRRLHDAAPGPQTVGTVTQTSSIPRTTGPARADPENALEDLKATIMRSAQEALKQSEVHGF